MKLIIGLLIVLVVLFLIFLVSIYNAIEACPTCGYFTIEKTDIKNEDGETLYRCKYCGDKRYRKRW